MTQIQYLVDGSNVINCETGEVKTVRATRPLLFISGSMYSEGYLLENVSLANYVARIAYQWGWAPIVPHYDILDTLITGKHSFERLLEVDLSLIRASSGVLQLPNSGEPDTGTWQEAQLALSLGIPIYRTNPWNLPWIREDISPPWIFSGNYHTAVYHPISNPMMWSDVKNRFDKGTFV